MLKSELRKIYLEKRKSLSAEEKNEKSRQIAENFFQNFALTKIRFLHCFLTIEKLNEVITKPIFESVWRGYPHIETLVPRVNSETNEIENLKITSETELKQSAWQIDEPAHDELIEPTEIDLVLVPLLAFDESGHRVGYGKGFYDRLLKKCRADCRKIGLSYFPPVAKIANAHESDVPLDFCVTPEEVFQLKIKN